MKKLISGISGRTILIGYIAALFIIAVLAMILATLILNAFLSENVIVAGACIILFLAGLIGSVIAGRGVQGGVAIRIAILGASLILSLLVICILVFNTRVGHLMANGLCTLGGCAVACAICIRKGKTRPKRKRAIW